MSKEQAFKEVNEWDSIAHNYIEKNQYKEPRSYTQLAEVLWESLGDVKDLDILDVGCGHGWFSERLSQAGANVTGIDVSSTFLSFAEANYPDVTFIQHDLTTGLPKLGRCFDFVVANMVLMDLKDIGNIVSSIREIIKPTGKFIFTITHPCFFNYTPDIDSASGQVYRKVSDYLKQSVWQIQSFGGHSHFHRSLTYYFEHLRANKFAISRFVEPANTPRDNNSNEYFSSHIPVFLLVETMPIS